MESLATCRLTPENFRVLQNLELEVMSALVPSPSLPREQARGSLLNVVAALCWGQGSELVWPWGCSCKEEEKLFYFNGCLPGDPWRRLSLDLWEFHRGFVSGLTLTSSWFEQTPHKHALVFPSCLCGVREISRRLSFCKSVHRVALVACGMAFPY